MTYPRHQRIVRFAPSRSGATRKGFATVNTTLIEKGIPAAIAVAGAVAIGAWVIGYVHAPATKERPLGTDLLRRAQMQPVGAASAPGTTASTGSPSGTSFTRATSAEVPAVPGEWPCFRGPNRDGISPDKTPLARTWPAQGPPVLWRIPMGEGYAAPAIHDSRVYVLDYDQAAQADTLRCFALANGSELWRRSYPVQVKRNHGMSRTIPAVSGKYVVTLGPKCNVMCVDRLTGDLVWKHDLVAELGATVPEWYAGQCPLIENGRVILAPGGPSLLVALDLATGKIVWRSPNPRQWQMTHVSVAPVTFHGKRMYVYCGSGGVAGLDAKTGAYLWDTTDWVINTATVPTAIPAGDGMIFLSGGYNAGAMMLKLAESNGKTTVSTAFRLAPAVFGSDQQTPLFFQNHLFGVIPGGQLVCLDVSGKQVWASGTQARFGLGPYVIADGLIYALSDAGVLTMAEASPTGYRQLGQAKVLEGPEAWGPIAVAGGRLICRDLNNMVCLDVSKH